MNRLVEKLKTFPIRKSVIPFFALLLLFLLCSLNPLFAQQDALVPGFNRDEFLNLLRMSARQVDTPFVKMLTPLPHAYTMTYRSATVGMDNRWDLWEAEGSPPVISIRGSTPHQVSWMENFYAAMLPAQGTVCIGKSEPISYCFSKHQDAGVHAGWLIGAVALSVDIFAYMKRSIDEGNTSFYLIGHSQGGAIAFLLNAWIHERIAAGYFPKELCLKTYCSAAPKPGNLQFAYDFEQKNQGGWAFNVLHPDDWVPETPASIQTHFDFNATNPFSDVRKFKKGRRFKERLAVGYLHRALTRHSKKAERKFRNYLGHKIEKPVRKHLNGLQIPDYLSTSNYVRCGNTIILKPDESYYERYPKKSDDLFIHHFHEPYRYLAEKLPPYFK
jgi:hypothetical protein